MRGKKLPPLTLQFFPEAEGERTQPQHSLLFQCQEISTLKLEARRHLKNSNCCKKLTNQKLYSNMRVRKMGGGENGRNFE